MLFKLSTLKQHNCVLVVHFTKTNAHTIRVFTAPSDFSTSVYSAAVILIRVFTEPSDFSRSDFHWLIDCNVFYPALVIAPSPPCSLPTLWCGSTVRPQCTTYILVTRLPATGRARSRVCVNYLCILLPCVRTLRPAPVSGKGRLLGLL